MSEYREMLYDMIHVGGDLDGITTSIVGAMTAVDHVLVEILET